MPIVVWSFLLKGAAVELPGFGNPERAYLNARNGTSEFNTKKLLSQKQRRFWKIANRKTIVGKETVGRCR